MDDQEVYLFATMVGDCQSDIAELLDATQSEACCVGDILCVGMCSK